MRPKHYEGKQRVCIANSVGPMAHFSKTETLQRETESLHCHLGETEIRIGETEFSRVSGCGYVKRTQWCWIDQIGGAKFDFGFWTYLELRKWLRDLEHITKHSEQVDH